MIEVTINWEDLKLKCELEPRGLTPDDGLCLYEAKLPNGSDFTGCLNERTIQEIEGLAIAEHEGNAEQNTIDRQLDAVEGWS